MKNIKIMLAAVAIPFSFCNVATAMNPTDLLKTLKTYIPSWMPGGNALELERYSQGSIQEAIEQLRLQLLDKTNPTYTGFPAFVEKYTGLVPEYEVLQESFTQKKADLIQAELYKNIEPSGLFTRFGRAIGWSTETAAEILQKNKLLEQAQKTIQKHPDYIDLLNQVQTTKEKIITNEQTISCLSNLKDNTQKLFDFTSNNKKILEQITPEYLTRNPEAQTIAKAAVEHLNKPSEAFSQCMSTVNGANIADYQELIPNTATDANSIQNALNQATHNNQWLLERWGNSLSSCTKDWFNWGSTKLHNGHQSFDDLSMAFNELHPAIRYTMIGITTLGIIYGIYALTTRKPTPKKFLTKLGYTAVGIATGAIAVGTLAIALNGMTLA